MPTLVHPEDTGAFDRGEVQRAARGGVTPSLEHLDAHAAELRRWLDEHGSAVPEPGTTTAHVQPVRMLDVPLFEPDTAPDLEPLVDRAFEDADGHPVPAGGSVDAPPRPTDARPAAASDEAAGETETTSPVASPAVPDADAGDRGAEPSPRSHADIAPGRSRGAGREIDTHPARSGLGWAVAILAWVAALGLILPLLAWGIVSGVDMTIETDANPAEPGTQQPAAEQPADQPAAEQPAADQPAADQPAAGETAS